MNKKAFSAVIALVLLSTWFNSALTYAKFNKATDDHYQPVVAIPNTIWVPDNYTTIQEAINKAKEGETIFVRSGTYFEHVVVSKTVSLIGENKQATIIDGNGTAMVVLMTANNITIRGFTIQNGELGILFWYSRDNDFVGNNVSNNQYGIYLWDSDKNAVTDNVASNNSQHGIYFGDSDDNVVSGNNVSNNQYGIYLDDSTHNILTGNALSNNQYGILLSHSNDNVFSSNNVSNSQYGIYFGDSDDNLISGNNVSNNQYGLYVRYSHDNILANNEVSNNFLGIYFRGSNNNAIFHNNFINNTQQARFYESGFTNFWDDGFPSGGNYWSDYTGEDQNSDGIGDTLYPVEETSRDNYPLMAMSLQFNITTEKMSYIIDTVSDSTISDFQFHSDPDNRTNTLSFKVNEASFCRISIPHALIEPPLVVRIDGNPPSYFKTVYTNPTRTWLYLAYDISEHEITIIQVPPSEQLLWFQWAIFGLAIIVVILFSITVNYYRLFNKQKKVIEAFEREVGSFPVSHEERARMRFIKDVIEREEKIENFKKKYGIEIRPSSTLEDLMEKLGVQKET